jgi:hypothetical protein
MTFIFKGHVGCEEFLLTFKNEGKHVLSKRREPSPDDSGSHPRRPRAVSSTAERASILTACCSMTRRHNHISGVLNAGRTSTPAAAALSALINPVSSPVRIISSRLLAFYQHVLRSLLCHLFHLWPSTVMLCSLIAQLSTMTFTTVYGISSIYIWSQAA